MIRHTRRCNVVLKGGCRDTTYEFHGKHLRMGGTESIRTLMPIHNGTNGCNGGGMLQASCLRNNQVGHKVALVGVPSHFYLPGQWCIAVEVRFSSLRQQQDLFDWLRGHDLQPSPHCYCSSSPQPTPQARSSHLQLQPPLQYWPRRSSTRSCGSSAQSRGYAPRLHSSAASAPCQAPRKGIAAAMCICCR
jgi:hypothetical protein